MPRPDFEALSRALRDDGGFSVGTGGQVPTRGAMVSIEGSERSIPGVASPDRLEEFYNSVAPVADATKHGYVGGWVSDGNTYLDVSQRFPDREQARLAVGHRNQLAGWDLDQSDEFTQDQVALFKTEVRPSHPQRRDIVGFMGGDLHGAVGLGERARRAERRRWYQPKLWEE